jgi:hypothetical protein
MLFGSDLQGLPGKRADEAIIGFDDLVPEHNPQRAAVSNHDLIRERRPGFVRSMSMRYSSSEASAARRATHPCTAVASAASGATSVKRCS